MQKKERKIKNSATCKGEANVTIKIHFRDKSILVCACGFMQKKKKKERKRNGVGNSSEKPLLRPEITNRSRIKEWSIRVHELIYDGNQWKIVRTKKKREKIEKLNKVYGVHNT